MSNSHELAINQKRLLPLIAYASGEGWQEHSFGVFETHQSQFTFHLYSPDFSRTPTCTDTYSNPQCARLPGVGGQDD